MFIMDFRDNFMSGRSADLWRASFRVIKLERVRADTMMLLYRTNVYGECPGMNGRGNNVFFVVTL